MAYNGSTAALFALDAVADGHKVRLRLLRVDPSGASTELWRTRAVHALPRAFVSVSQEGEVVVSLRHDQRSEFVTTDRNGVPQLSGDVHGRLWKGAIGSAAGISLPLEQKPHQDQSNLRLVLVKRPEAARGLCGAPWLLHHADLTLQDALSSAASVCAPPSVAPTRRAGQPPKRPGREVA